MQQTAQRPLRALGRNVWVLMANSMLTQGSLAVLGLAQNLYLTKIGFREDFIGLASFVSVAAIAACAVPVGYLSNRVGPRLCIIASGVVMGVASALIALTTHPAIILAAGALLGAGQALVFVPTAPFLMESARPEDRMRVWSINFASVAVGSVAGSALAGYLPGVVAAVVGTNADSVVPLRITLLVGSALLLASAGPMLAARRQADVGDASAVTAAPPEAVLSPQGVRRLLKLNAVAVVLVSLSTGAIFPFFNVYYVDHLGLTVADVGIVFAVGSLLMVPGSLLGPEIGRRIGVVRAIALGRALSVPLFVVLAFSPSAFVGISTYLLRNAFISGTWPLDNAFAMQLVGPRSRAVLAGTRSASWNLGWAVASLIAGQAIVLSGYPVVFIASAVLMMAGLVFHYRLFIGYERRPPSE